MGYSTPYFSPTGGMKISALILQNTCTCTMAVQRHKELYRRSAKQCKTKVSDGEGSCGLAIMTTEKIIPGKIYRKGDTGSAYGLYSMMFFQPKEKFGIVVITNGCNVTHYDDFNPALKAAVNVLCKEEMIKQQVRCYSECCHGMLTMRR